MVDSRWSIEDGKRKSGSGKSNVGGCQLIVVSRKSMVHREDGREKREGGFESESRKSEVGRSHGCGLISSWGRKFDVVSREVLAAGRFPLQGRKSEVGKLKVGKLKVGKSSPSADIPFRGSRGVRVEGLASQVGKPRKPL